MVGLRARAAASVSPTCVSRGGVQNGDSAVLMLLPAPAGAYAAVPTVFEVAMQAKLHTALQPAFTTVFQRVCARPSLATHCSCCDIAINVCGRARGLCAAGAADVTTRSAVRRGVPAAVAAAEPAHAAQVRCGAPPPPPTLRTLMPAC
jgi:hypothetical protein